MIVAGPNARGVKSYTQEMLDNLYRCYYNSLVLAAQNNATSIAFPSISTGIYAFNPALAAKIATQAIEDFAKADDSNLIGELRKVTICVYGSAWESYRDL